MMVEKATHDRKCILRLRHIRVVEKAVEETILHVQFDIDTQFGKLDIGVDRTTEGKVAITSDQQCGRKLRKDRSRRNG